MRLNLLAQMRDEIGIVLLLRLLVGGGDGVRRRVGVEPEYRVRRRLICVARRLRLGSVRPRGFGDFRFVLALLQLLVLADALFLRLARLLQLETSGLLIRVALRLFSRASCLLGLLGFSLACRVGNLLAAVLAELGLRFRGSVGTAGLALLRLPARTHHDEGEAADQRDD